ncbi:MAG TPA: hypothetical protein VK816_10030 [Jatrophihabitantaceae bacterium]|nr:hypothetical protein [Jatrophihabitantaceae bacterium]
MNIIRGERQDAEGGHADGARKGTLTRRGVLGGLAAIPVLYGIGSTAPALATTPKPKPGAPKATADTAELVRGVERRYNAPLLSPGTRLVLPDGIKAVPIQDYYHRPHLAAVESAWPRMRAVGGATVNASIIPEAGAPTRIAMLSGFKVGWYELIHANGRADRVTWDASKLPFLWFYGEFGATNEAPYQNRFYTLALQPFSRNPYLPQSLAS